jgi:hypothetical protein
MLHLLTDLFEKITLWDVETRGAVVERTGTGEYQVAMRGRPSSQRESH